MANDLGKHKRWNRKSRHLIKLLGKTRVKSVRLKILEELNHEINRAKESRAGKALKRGAIGTAKWGKRVAGTTVRTTRVAVRSGGQYARKQAIEREKNRPAREAAKLQHRKERDTARLARQQRTTRRAQRVQQGTSPVARVRKLVASRQAPQTTARKPAARKPAASRTSRAATANKPSRAVPARPALAERPAASERAARSTRTTAPDPAVRVTPAKTARPARTSRSSKVS